MDFIIQRIACKHIHAVQTLRVRSKRNEQNKSNENNAMEDFQYFEGFLRATDIRGGYKSDLETVKISISNRINTLMDTGKVSIRAARLRSAMAHANSDITLAQGLNKLEHEHLYDVK